MREEMIRIRSYVARGRMWK